jgi:hypothetical protein
MLRLILEPIYESKFYRLSFGFRPYRSTHHAALELHWLMSRHGYNVVVEGDIRKCFDRVQHNTLLNILRRTIKDGRVIHLVGQLLKAGVMEDNAWHISDEGTPQGGIVSPLLANVYLNELDWYIAAKWDLLIRPERDKRRRINTACPIYIVRYADDFVIAIKGSLEKGEAIKQEVAASTTSCGRQSGIGLNEPIASGRGIVAREPSMPNTGYPTGSGIMHARTGFFFYPVRCIRDIQRYLSYEKDAATTPRMRPATES